MTVNFSALTLGSGVFLYIKIQLNFWWGNSYKMYVYDIKHSLFKVNDFYFKLD
jgi:hypothetical protein